MKSSKKITPIMLIASVLIGNVQQMQANDLSPLNRLGLAGAALALGATGAGLAYCSGKNDYKAEHSTYNRGCGILAPLAIGFDKLFTVLPCLVGSLGAFAGAEFCAITSIYPSENMLRSIESSKTLSRVCGGLLLIGSAALVVAPLVSTACGYDEGYTKTKASEEEKRTQNNLSYCLNRIQQGDYVARLLPNGKIGVFHFLHGTYSQATFDSKYAHYFPSLIQEPTPHDAHANDDQLAVYGNTALPENVALMGGHSMA